MDGLNGTGSVNSVQGAVQMYALKKTMDNQYSQVADVLKSGLDQSAALEKAAQPHKGQNIDVRI